MSSLPAAMQPARSKGFTFTISIIILSITLIALAGFAQDYRNESVQMFSSTQSSGGAIAGERVSADISRLFGVRAISEKENSTTLSNQVEFTFPFRKEGMPLADFPEYSSSLAYTMQGSGLESLVSSPSSSSAYSGMATVNFSNGSYSWQSNNGSTDAALYAHPIGLSPSYISISIQCEKNASGIGQFESTSSSPSSQGTQFRLNFTDASGRSTIREASAQAGSNTSIAISFADYSSLSISSYLASSSQNVTIADYTKSPGAKLVLPFDNPLSPLRDYSPSQQNITSGAGAAAPTRLALGCKYGGCYQFDGADDYLSAVGAQLFESSPAFIGGAALDKNGGFETLGVGSTAGDSSPDTFSNWVISNPDANVSYFAVNSNTHYGNAVNVTSFGDAENDSRIWQNIADIRQNAPYTLTFYTRGDGSVSGRYRVYDATAGKYMQSDGSWSSSIINLSTGVAANELSKVSVSVVLPQNSSQLSIMFLPPDSQGSAVYDTAMLSRQGTLNGGFEYYYSENGSADGLFYMPERNQSLARGNATQYCWQKQCNSSVDCTGNDAPYCGSGCNLLTHTCNANAIADNFCRAAGSFCPDTPAFDCCGDAYCSSGVCLPRIACGASCSSSAQCGLSCPYCALPSAGGAATCRSCIPQNSTTACTQSSQCCDSDGSPGGICNLGAASASFSQCVSCLPENGRVCSADSDCCDNACRDGTCIANSAPSTPPTPSISPATAASSTLIYCALNCPPTQAPSDAELDYPLIVQYRWYKNGVAITSYWHNRTDFRCDEQSSCSAGDRISLKSRVCDPHGACTESSSSTLTTISSTSSPSCNSVGSSCAFGSSCCAGLACSFSSSGSPTGLCCIPSDPTRACSSDSDCCSGKCQPIPGSPSASYCVPLYESGASCGSHSQCADGSPFCATDSSGSNATCRSCIPQNSSASCAADSDCCVVPAAGKGLCNLLPGSANYTKCASCLPENHTCSSDSDCCGLRCNEGADGVKKCRAAFPSCSQRGARCLSTSDCCTPPTVGETLFCDTQNRFSTIIEPLLGANTTGGPISSYGSCESCFPSYNRCDGSHSCCDATFTCRTTTGGAGSYCLPPTPLSPTVETAYGWAIAGSATFSLVSAPVHSGARALSLSGNNSAYIYSTEALSAARGERPYLLEFWANSSSGATGVRFAVLDEYNNAFLDSAGEWVRVNVSGTTITQDIVLNSSLTTGPYAHYGIAFKTLPGAKLQLRFYPPDSGTAYLDDVTLTELRDFTIAAWVKAGSNAAGAPLLYQTGTEDSASQGVNWHFETGRILNATFLSSHGKGTAGAGISWTTFDLSDAGWHLVAISVSRAGNYSAYLDGSLGLTGAFQLGRLNSSSALLIGSTGASYFNGTLDELRIYGRALSASEISGIHSARFQSPCTVSIKSTYLSSSISSTSPYALYNARILLRKLHPSAILSLPFDANVTSNSTGAIPDYSPAQTACTRSGASNVPGKYGAGAYSFSASTDRILCTKPVLNGTGDFTISAWVYPTSVSGTRYIGGNLGLGSTNGTKLVINGGTPTLYIGGSSISSSISAPANFWTHIVAKRENGQATIFVNTLLGGNGTLSGAIGSNLNFSIGNAPDHETDAFSGRIDELRVFSRAIDANETAALYYDRNVVYDASPTAVPP